MLRELAALGALVDIERIASEDGCPFAMVLTRDSARDVCRARWRAWLWLHDHRRVRAGQIAAIWGVAESTVWYGLGRAAGVHRLPLAECRRRLERIGVRAEAEAICTELGVSLDELMSPSKRPPVVRARRRLWRGLLAAGRKPGAIAAAWGMDRAAVCAARGERRAA
jgi:hypothetical protein